MMQPEQALTGDSEGIPDHPVLPGAMQRGALEGLLSDVSASLGMPDSLLKALLTMMRETRPADWTDPSREPVCFAMQASIAALLGKSGRSIRRNEAALIRLGFIDKRVAGNGWRCRVAFADGTEFAQGLSFTPLIGKVPDLLALRERVRFERQHGMQLRRQCSALKRNVKERLMALQPQCPDDPELTALADRFLGWPARYDVFTTLDALQAHHAEMRETSEAEIRCSC